MVLSAALNAVLSKKKRQQQLSAENQNEYTRWKSDVYSELEVFIRRVSDIDPSDSDDRTEFYKQTDRLHDRLTALRDQSVSSSAPTSGLIKLEDLVDNLDDLSAAIRPYSYNLNETPAQERRREEMREELEEQDAEQACEEIEALGTQIQSLLSALEGEQPGSTSE
jgi:hypothetical protein